MQENKPKTQKKDYRSLPVLILFILIISGLTYIDSFLKSELEDIRRENIKAFKKSNDLICSPSPRSKSYLVSKNRGWSIHKAYFLKDDTLISVASCKGEK